MFEGELQALFFGELSYGGVVGEWRDASRRATSPCAVQEGSVARLSPVCPRFGSSGRPRGGSSPRDAGPMWDRGARRTAP
jgi:hypothetical protein